MMNSLWPVFRVLCAPNVPSGRSVPARPDVSCLNAFVAAAIYDGRFGVRRLDAAFPNSPRQWTGVRQKRYHRSLMNHEVAVIKAFFVPTKRERYLGFMATAKGRAKIIAELSHFKALDPRFMKKIIPSQHDPASVAKLIRSKGAGPTCWVISKISDLDGKEVDLLLALKETIGAQMGTIISCIPGKLGYFADEDGRCLLER